MRGERKSNMQVRELMKVMVRVMTPVPTAVLSTMLMSVGLGTAPADPMEKKGTTPYVTLHFPAVAEP
jgi:hypothetical protein